MRLAAGQTDRYGEAAVRLYATERGLLLYRFLVGQIKEEQDRAADNQLRSAGFFLQDGIWKGASIDLFLEINRLVASRYINRYITALGATRLPDLNTKPDMSLNSADEDRAEMRTGLEHIQLPYSIHGGALLRAVGLNNLKKGEKANRILLATGDLAFQRIGDALHFFGAGVSKKAESNGGSIEHMRVVGANLEEVYAAGQVIRFLLRFNGHEGRGKKVKLASIVHNIRKNNAEVRRNITVLDEVSEDSYVVWREYLDAPSSPVLSSPITGPELEELGITNVDGAGLRVSLVADGALIIEVRASGVKEHLDAEWERINSTKNVARGIGHVRRLELAGFYDLSDARAEKVLGWLVEAQGNDVYDAGKSMLLNRLLKSDMMAIFANASPMLLAQVNQDRSAIRILSQVQRRKALRLGDVKRLSGLLHRLSRAVSPRLRCAAYEMWVDYLGDLNTRGGDKRTERALKALVEEAENAANTLRALRYGADTDYGPRKFKTSDGRSIMGEILPYEPSSEPSRWNTAAGHEQLRNAFNGRVVVYREDPLVITARVEEMRFDTERIHLKLKVLRNVGYPFAKKTFDVSAVWDTISFDGKAKLSAQLIGWSINTSEGMIKHIEGLPSKTPP